MEAVWVVDAAAVAALGDDLEDLWCRLLAGETAIRPTKRFCTDAYVTCQSACIGALGVPSGGSLVYPLLDMLLSSLGGVPQDARLLTATTKAGIDSVESLGRGRGGDGSDAVASHVLTFLADTLGLSCRCTNINAACASATIAVARGAGLIASGKADAVLVCCFDLVSEFVFSGFSALRALSPGACTPFDRDRGGLTLGEGAAAILMMSEKRARKEKRSGLATILGWGIANDATHITAPARDGCGLVQSINQALERSKTAREDIAGINAHGTGTVYNDLMELKAFHRVFGDRALPIHSVKGAIGHTLGAAGGIELCVGFRSLQEGVLPPTVGFANPEEGAGGMVSNAAVPLDGDILLKCNSGFGGINAAVVLRKGSDL